MKSIKPGRGPSFMGGIASIASGLFGVFWTIMAVGMGVWFMAPFGLIFIGLAIANAVYNFKNATGENRYSSYDILDLTEEPDPLNERFGEVRNTPEKKENTDTGKDKKESRFCPWCGEAVEGDFVYCNHCGRKLP